MVDDVYVYVYESEFSCEPKQEEIRKINTQSVISSVELSIWANLQEQIAYDNCSKNLLFSSHFGHDIPSRLHSFTAQNKMPKRTQFTPKMN